MDEFDILAERIANEWYGGTLPNHPTVIVETLLNVVTRDLDLPETIPTAVVEEAKKRFADSLASALSDRIAAQDADRAPWKC